MYFLGCGSQAPQSRQRDRFLRGPSEAEAALPWTQGVRMTEMQRHACIAGDQRGDRGLSPARSQRAAGATVSTETAAIGNNLTVSVEDAHRELAASRALRHKPQTADVPGEAAGEERGKGRIKIEEEEAGATGGREEHGRRRGESGSAGHQALVPRRLRAEDGRTGKRRRADIMRKTDGGN
ncbi:hypothetical protein GN956_G19948 [Arapaima gigas]